MVHLINPLPKFYEALWKFTQLIARLQEAIYRQVSHEEAAKIILHQLAYDSANEECKRALASVFHTRDLSTYIQTCHNIGSTTHASVPSTGYIPTPY